MIIGSKAPPAEAIVIPRGLPLLNNSTVYTKDWGDSNRC